MNIYNVWYKGKKGVIVLGIGAIAGGIAGGLVVLGGAGCVYGALKLFNMTIPRQDTVRVDINEMADAKQWEEYKKKIAPRREWVMAQNPEKVQITARDGLKLCGLYLPAEEESEYLVIALHGYTSDKSSSCSQAYFFNHIGMDCIMPDHRAHGESEGEYVGFGIIDRFDCLEWINYVNKRFDGKKKIILYGVSMGASTAVMAAGLSNLPSQVKAVISDCAFTSPYDIFSHILKRDYKLAPFPVMNINENISRKKAGYGFNDYSTLTAVQETDIPIFFIHGKEDKFVPVWMSEKNYETCKSPKRLLLIENAGHGASFFENTELYEKEVTEFLNEYVFNK